MDAVTKGTLLADLGQKFHGLLSHFNVLFLTPNVQNLADFFVRVWRSRDDQRSIKEIDWQTMWGLVVSATDLGNTSVGGHNDNWCLIGLKSSI